MATIWKGNRLPVLEYTFTVGNAAFDLTGSTVTFSMRPTNSATLKVSAGAAVLADPTAGEVTYAWAAADVDVVGDYLGWMTYSINGKSQDAPEFAVAVVAHAPEVTAWQNPVDADGNTAIFQGDSYLAAKNTALVYDLSLQNQPTLTGGTVTWKINGQGSAITATISDPSTVSVDLSSAQTAIFTTGTWDFALTANMGGGNTHTILRSKITVAGSLT